MERITHSPDESWALAREFAPCLAPGARATIVELIGNLGAGKTTFMKGVGQYFGVREEMVSPTFLIARHYDLSGQPFARLIHIDAYRLEKESELAAIGWENMASDPANLIFIEWPANMQTDLAAAHRITFEHIGETERRITIHEHAKNS